MYDFTDPPQASTSSVVPRLRSKSAIDDCGQQIAQKNEEIVELVIQLATNYLLHDCQQLLILSSCSRSQDLKPKFIAFTFFHAIDSEGQCLTSFTESNDMDHSEALGRSFAGPCPVFDSAGSIFSSSFLAIHI